MLPDLWTHQAKAKALNPKKFAFFFEMGTGKTRTIFELFNQSKYDSGLIIAPVSVCRNWPIESEMYSKTKKILVCSGSKISKKKKLKMIEDFKNRKAPAILVINNEMLRSEEYFRALLAINFNFITVDESHNFKNADTLQTKRLIFLKQKVNPDHFYLLTGTPTPNGDLDLWSTFYLLDETRLPFFQWKKRYFYDAMRHRQNKPGYYPIWKKTKGAEAEFTKILQRISMVAKKNEVLDLPPFVRTRIFCEQTKEQEFHYKEFINKLFTFDETGKKHRIRNVLAKTVKLQMLLAGYLGETKIPSNRLAALDAAVELVGTDQFVIWTIFSKTYSEISQHLLAKYGIECGFITGEQSPEDRAETLAKFQAQQIRYLIANPKAGGAGINMNAANWSIHFTRSFNLEHDLQCEARTYRGGSEKHDKVTRIDIICENSVDEEIAKSLLRKDKEQQFVLGLQRLLAPQLDMEFVGEDEFNQMEATA